MEKRFLCLTIVLCMITSLITVMPVSSKESINIGDYIQMGTYYGKPILWRCVDIDENGPLMLSDKILCLKPFDASGTDTYGSHGRGYVPDTTQGAGYYRKMYGSDYWVDSNIRCWLNSGELMGSVRWTCNNPPYEENVYNGYNDYADEAGFLSNFTPTERKAIKIVTQKSLLNVYEFSDSSNSANSDYHQYNSSINDVLQNYDTAYSEQVTDMMFLLDVKQINAVYNNGNILGENYYIGTPTQEAVENSEYKNSNLSAGYVWDSWLRSSNAEGSGTSVRTLDHNGNVSNSVTYSSGVGVRPAFYLDPDACKYTSGDGTQSNPYITDGITDTAQPAISNPCIKIGEYLQMGTYYGKPILWRCVDIDENGPLMLSDKVICLKAFDACGTNISGSHCRGTYYRGTQGFYRQQIGSNYWADSNIRDWLNSEDAAGDIVWNCGNPPDEEHVSDGYNEYDNEAGFLSNFTENEISVIKTVTQKALLDGYEYSDFANIINPDYHIYALKIDEIMKNYYTAFSEKVTDKVFLLDIKQLSALYSNKNILGDKYYMSYPTVEAVSNSEYQSDNLTASRYWVYWLRSPGAKGNSMDVRRVEPSGDVGSWDANLSICGIRPAFYLDNRCTFKTGDGTSVSPYEVPHIKTDSLLSFEAQTETSVTIKVEKSDIPENSVVILALYSDNKLMDIVTKEYAEEVLFDNLDLKDVKIKALLWDGMNSLKPITKAIEE